VNNKIPETSISKSVQTHTHLTFRAGDYRIDIETRKTLEGESPTWKDVTNVRIYSPKENIGTLYNKTFNTKEEAKEVIENLKTLFDLTLQELERENDE